MAKYKVGDKVRIVSERPKDFAYADNMGKYLGKTFIVSMVKWHPLFGNLYSLEGAIIERGACAGPSWVFKESWISGLAEPEREPCTVELRFDGMITTATLFQSTLPVGGATAKMHRFFCESLAKVYLFRVLSPKIPGIQRLDFRKASLSPAKVPANLPGISGRFGFAWGQADHLSEDQRVLRQIGVLCPEMLHLFLVLVAKIVKAQAILLRVHDGQEFGLQHPTLTGIQQALKHGILHPLTVIHALFRNLPQTFTSGGILGVHIVSNQYQHNITSIERADRRPNLPESVGPVAVPGHRAPCPSSFSPPDRGG